MGSGESPAAKMAMTQATRFDGLRPLTSKKGDVTLQSVSADGKKIAVVLDKNSLIERYDDDGRAFYLSTGEGTAVKLEPWQVSAQGTTVDAKSAGAHVVVLDQSTFNRQTVSMNTPTNTKGDFKTYKKTAQMQSKAQGDNYGMGFVSGFDSNDNPTTFEPVFKESGYGKSYTKKKKK